MPEQLRLDDASAQWADVRRRAECLARLTCRHRAEGWAAFDGQRALAEWDDKGDAVTHADVAALAGFVATAWGADLDGVLRYVYAGEAG